MKKLLLIFSSTAILLSSCNLVENKKILAEDKIKVTTSIGGGANIALSSVDYDKHKYIIFESGSGSIFVLHSPNCECNDNRPN